MSDSHAPVRGSSAAEWDGASSGEVTAPAHGTAVLDGHRADPGGLSFAAVFFGWLVSVAFPGLLIALTGVAAAVAGISMGLTRHDAREQAQAIGLAGALLLVLFVLLGHFAGGYVAGRMARAGASRHGVGVWVFGLLASIVMTVAGAAVTTGYSLNDRLGLTTVSMPASAFDARGIFAFACLLLTTLLAAVLGARAGRRYHLRVAGGAPRSPSASV